MTKSELLKLDEIVKTLKSDMFYITNNVVIGLDKSMTVLSDIECNINIGDYEFDKKVWDMFIKTVKEEKQERADYLPWFKKFCTIRFCKSPILRQYDKMMTVYMEDSCDEVTKINNFEKSELFEIYSKMRADDGAKLFKLDQKHMFYLAAGMLPVNKGDTVNLVIGDYYRTDGDGNKQFVGFVIHYYIFKKKLKLTLHRTISYLALC